jgi:hypothetical protein
VTSLPDLVAELRALRAIVEAQGERLLALEIARDPGTGDTRGLIAANDARRQAVLDRGAQMGPKAGAMKWSDPNRRMSDNRLLDIVRSAIPDPDGTIVSRDAARRAVESALGKSRQGDADRKCGAPSAHYTRKTVGC